VQFLKSLLCLRGNDNRTRFFAICSATYVIFIMLSSAFTDNTFISLVLSVVFSLILGLTNLRRLNDAKLNKKWLLAPSITFTLVAIVIIFSKQNSSYYLLIIPSLLAAVLLTYPNKTKQSNIQRNYTLGYSGPINMKEYQASKANNIQAKKRIEPTLMRNHSEDFSHSDADSFQEKTTNRNSYTQSNTAANQQTDLGELIRLKLLNNQKVQLTVAAFIGLTCIGAATSWLISYLNTNDDIAIEESENRKAISISPSMIKKHPLQMPDNYTLYLSEYNGISINWQADEVQNTTLWSQLTAQGDNSCKEISFNKGDAIRTLSVQVEKTQGLNINYFASFSPLDSKTLIQALAFRGNFSLCGYNFSLKGSQAALVKNEKYAQWIDY